VVLHIRQSGSDLKHFRSWGIDSKPDYVTNASDDGESSDDESFDSPKITEELDEFAQWAFGENGLQSLRVLAFGDFSYNGRYSRGNVLLCRQYDSATSKSPGKNYRYFTSRDLPEWRLFQKHFDVLQACPTDLLLKD
jgi:hypothetical protein